MLSIYQQRQTSWLGASTSASYGSNAECHARPVHPLRRPHRRTVRRVAAELKQEERTAVSPGRLFSLLNPGTLRHEPGSVLGAASLVAGTTVGAGILALPAVAAPAGFAASSTALLGCYAYAITTGLLIAEVSLNTMCELGGAGTSLSSMTERTLGQGASRLTSITFLGLQWTLLVAYTSKGGGVAAELLGVSTPMGAGAFVAAMLALCYGAPPRVLDNVNTLLVGGVVASFTGLLVLAAGELLPGALLDARWEAVPQALPVMALAFVYQNVVPSICTSLEGDVRKVRSAVVLGCTVPLLMFLLWDAAILGNPVNAAAAGGIVGDPVAQLRASSAAVAPLVDAFTLFAIATSFIGFLVALADFFADAFGMPVGARQPLPYLLAALPPYLLAVTYPDLFFTALDLAGTYGVLVLFGLLPPAMAWAERYGNVTLSRYEAVPGGRPLLVGTAVVAGAIIGNELLQALGAM